MGDTFTETDSTDEIAVGSAADVGGVENGGATADAASPAASVAGAGDSASQPVAEKKLQVFRDVPEHDPRTIVLQFGEKLLDLQFCTCPNKYKKRFAEFVKESGDFLEKVKDASVAYAAQGHKDVDIQEILNYVRGVARIGTTAEEYIRKYPHDFKLEVIERQYLIRKLMMEEPKLFGFFELTPVKCKSNCGYPEPLEPAEKTEDGNIAGF